MGELLIFNRLGSNTQRDRSVIGDDLENAVGTNAYSTGKFGDALDASSSFNAVKTVAAFSSLPEEFCIEFWMYDANSTGGFRRWVVNTITAGEGSGDFLFREANGFPALAYNGGSATSGTAVIRNAWTHYAFGYDGSDFYVYQNGTSILTATKTAETWNTPIYTPGYYDQPAPKETGNVKIDNFKIRGYAKKNFDNRGVERFGCRDQITAS